MSIGDNKMRIKKLLANKNVKVRDLLLISDKNEAKHDVADMLDDIILESNKFKGLLIISENNDGEMSIWETGFDVRDLAYIAELIRAKSMADGSPDLEDEGW
jgi:hypothetical protein